MIREQITLRGVNDPEVIRALTEVPRHKFIPDKLQPEAYEDCPLPIGYSQTISQPYIVAYMLEALQLKPEDRVLEVGVGSGYQAALLSRIVKQVFGIEIVTELANTAAEQLANLGYHNVKITTCNGWNGLPEQAPYEAIIVAATASKVPVALIEQLAEGGRLILPVGKIGSVQQLVLINKSSGGITRKNLIGVSFVPLVNEVTE